MLARAAVAMTTFGLVRDSLVTVVRCKPDDNAPRAPGRTLHCAEAAA
jgi:hypothetical protein